MLSVFSRGCAASFEETEPREGMRSWFISTALLAGVATSAWLAQDAAACSEICYTTELRGFAPGGIPGCTCSGSEAGARTGAGGCNCGQCYEKTQGVVYGFAINTDGTCTYGTDCGSCEYSLNASSSSSTDTGSSFVTATPSPVLASNGSSSTMNATSTGSSSESRSASHSAGSSSSSSSIEGGSDNTGSHAGSEARDKKLSTWQIVLAICCTVLLFATAVVSVFACYCKARSRLNEHEDDPAIYYREQQHAPQQA